MGKRRKAIEEKGREQFKTLKSLGITNKAIELKQLEDIFP